MVINLVDNRPQGFLFAKKYLKKFDLSVDIINFKVYNKDIELGTT